MKNLLKSIVIYLAIIPLSVLFYFECEDCLLSSKTLNWIGFSSVAIVFVVALKVVGIKGIGKKTNEETPDEEDFLEIEKNKPDKK